MIRASCQDLVFEMGLPWHCILEDRIARFVPHANSNFHQKTPGLNQQYFVLQPFLKLSHGCYLSFPPILPAKIIVIEAKPPTAYQSFLKRKKDYHQNLYYYFYF